MASSFKPSFCHTRARRGDRNLQKLRLQRTATASFNRGPLVEGLIGANRYQRLSVNRGFFRQTGLVATARLLAVTRIGHNLVSLHAWHTRRGLPEPWQAHLGGACRRPAPGEGDPHPRPPQAPNRLTGPARASHPHEVGASLPAISAKRPKPASRHTKSAPAERSTTGATPGTTKLPVGLPPAGSFGKPKRVVQGTTHWCARGDLNPHARKDTAT